MTTMIAAARPSRDERVRSVPWRRMVWVTWRQHRLALTGLAGLYGAAALLLLIEGLRMHDAYAAVTACHPASSSICRGLASAFQSTYGPGVELTVLLLQALPALVGVFIGAPLLARELETGTFRYAWTQGFGRTRWAIAKLALIAVAVVLVAGALGALVSWYLGPITSSTHDTNPFNRMDPTIFNLLGIAQPAWTLAAFAMGALAGTLIRRVVPAMFAALVAWVGLAFLAGGVLRQRYQPALTAPVKHMTPSALEGVHGLVLGWEWTRGGRPVALSVLNQTLRAIHLQAIGPLSFEPAGSPSAGGVNPLTYLQQHGYQLVTIYQPDSRFWTFQWIEGGWLLTLSLLLLAVTVWLVRRRGA